MKSLLVNFHRRKGNIGHSKSNWEVLSFSKSVVFTWEVSLGFDFDFGPTAKETIDLGE